MFEIVVQQDMPVPVVSVVTMIEQAAVATLTYAGAKPGQVTVLLTDEATIQALNRDYRQLDKVTDVLSFEDGTPSGGGTRIYWGDIAISWPTLVAQATAGGHSVEAELQLLVVHGVLHLLGYDHGVADEKAAMWAAQAAVLAALGAEITGPVETV